MPRWLGSASTAVDFTVDTHVTRWANLDCACYYPVLPRAPAPSDLQSKAHEDEIPRPIRKGYHPARRNSNLPTALLTSILWSRIRFYVPNFPRIPGFWVIISVIGPVSKHVGTLSHSVHVFTDLSSLCKVAVRSVFPCAFLLRSSAPLPQSVGSWMARSFSFSSTPPLGIFIVPRYPSPALLRIQWPCRA